MTSSTVQGPVPAYEHVVVVMSIVLGLAVTQLLKGAAQLYRRRSRVRTYWLHWAWAALLVFFSRELPPAPDVPTTVILAGKPASLPPGGLPFDTERYARAVQQRRVQHLRSWVRHGGEFLVAANAGHMVHADDPALVIAAIRRLRDDW